MMMQPAKTAAITGGHKRLLTVSGGLRVASSLVRRGIIIDPAKVE